MSNSGVLLIAREKLLPKTLLEFHFTETHNLRPFTLYGVVVRNCISQSVEHAYEVGVIFFKAPEHVGDMIRGMGAATASV